MGRVSKYKKTKILDLDKHEKKGGAYDEPPSVWQDRNRKREKEMKGWFNPDSDLFNQREALRVLNEQKSRAISSTNPAEHSAIKAAGAAAKAVAMDGRRPGESKRDFNGMGSKMPRFFYREV